ncbi:hypothetical protein N0V93_008002 [Gnomoniopsis smithogilvyi]|uniref:Arylsulfotransferase n=1 Tax=Gnomoniopsis smithogilvyi TaxID=1191159 RepID=A0A9W8YKX1_9PEZI|nr:hypothetical protein N0V93_008002 [Gnomoniopsis smithogilvyi]
MLSHLDLPMLGLIILIFGTLVSGDVFSEDYTKYNDAEYGKQPTQTFVSNQNVVAPLIQVNVWNEDKISPTGGSHIFIRHDYGNSSPLILDASDLSVVYMNRSFDRTSDIRVQKIGNESYVTFYSGSIVDGHGVGDGLVLDSHYHEAFKVNVHGLSVKNDLHEFQLTDQGTALITAYPEIKTDLRKWRGSRRGYLLDGVFQEVDIKTGEVLFQWEASKHVDPADSYYKVERKWDYFHINSIQKSRDGNYLVSARHMHSIYMINGQTGEIMWTLGGKKNQFREIAAVDGANKSGDDLLTFAWQHHARFVNGNENEITFFDNHALTTQHDCQNDCSRGLRIRLDFDSDPEKPTVQIVTEYLHPQSLQAQSQGSVQTLEDGSGNVFVGWGRCPTFTEHTAEGEAVMDVQFSPWHTQTNTIALDNYRAYRMDWKATPDWDPDVMSKQEDGVVTVYASWNGATEVKAWAFLASNESVDLYGPSNVLAIVPRNGFETSFSLTYPARFARAAALDADWNILGSSGIVDIANELVHADVQPVTSVKETKHVVFTDEGAGYSATTHEDYPGQSTLFGIPLGWPTVMCVGLLVGLWAAARFF